MNQDKIYLECACSSKDHLVCISLDEYDWGTPENKQISFYIETQMSVWATFFQRLWFAFLFVFNPYTRCRFGGWSQTIVKVEDAKKVKLLLEEFIRSQESTDEGEE